MLSLYEGIMIGFATFAGILGLVVGLWRIVTKYTDREVKALRDEVMNTEAARPCRSHEMSFVDIGQRLAVVETKMDGVSGDLRALREDLRVVSAQINRIVSKIGNGAVLEPSEIRRP